MGGQACVLYGAAEFSRDLDLALLPNPANLDRLEAALAELDAEIIAVPSAGAWPGSSTWSIPIARFSG